jgi:hypothetical protein
LIGFHKIPINIFQSWVDSGVITLHDDNIPEGGDEMSNLPVLKESVSLPTTPKEQMVQASEMAKMLQDLVKQAGLSRKLGGRKEHLEFEAWQTIARWFHCTVSTEWSKPIKEGDKIIGWEARVNVLDADGKVIGSSEGMCMSDEQNWRGKPSYALRSMAQTRTAGKALRSLFAHIAVLAGYSPTPAEEMDGVEVRHEPPPQAHKPSPPNRQPGQNEMGEHGVPPDTASPAQKKKLFAMAMERFKERDLALAFIRHSLDLTGAEYWTKSMISEFFDSFKEQADAYEQEMMSATS